MRLDCHPLHNNHSLSSLPYTIIDAMKQGWSTCSSAILAIVIISVGILRIYYCCQLPVNTNDVLRHIQYGLLVNENGLRVAGLPLDEIGADFEHIPWHTLPYNYPIVTLLFFTLVARTSPTVFFAKLALTLLEALNSLILFRYSREKWLALIYWASPVSIWWVSHEAQFEPLQNLFVLTALCLLSKKRSRESLVFLTIAIQVKVSAVFLLPFFIYSIKRQIEPKHYLTALVVGSMPTVYSRFFFPSVENVFRYSSALVYNPYYWNFLRTRIFLWTAQLRWFMACNQISSYLMLAVLVALAFRQRNAVQLLAPIAFLVFVKVRQNAQFWYMALFQPFLLPIRNKKLRFLLFLLTPLLDIRSTLQILLGPFGFVGPDFYTNITPFTVLSTPG